TVVVLIALVLTHGQEYLFAAVLVAGLLQLLVGVLKLGKFVRLIPQPVMYGFLNGLAIIIFLAQIEQFKVLENGTYHWMAGGPLWTMVALTVLTILVVIVWPRITKTVPASLVAILITFGLVSFFGIDTKKVIHIATVSGSFPPLHLPVVPFTWETLTIIFPYAAIMASVGLIESLLTLNMVDEITTSKGNSNKEAVAQGAANMVNGLFSGMGGCAMVAQTLVNLNAGGRTRFSAAIGALGVLFVILVGSSFIEQIPMAALVGVMIMVAIGTFQWVSIRLVNKMPIADILVGMLVAAITVVLHNLALAVLVGVIISAIVFAWDN